MYKRRIRNQDLTGKRSGSITIVQYLCQVNGKSLWKYTCDCGGEGTTYTFSFNAGDIKKCELCRHKKAPKVKKHKLYSVWINVKCRCRNPNNKSYSVYGGRGVRVCEEWESFDNFFKWAIANGWKEGLHLDKDIDSTGIPIYSPQTCRFVTQRENNRHKRSTILKPEDVAQIKSLNIPHSELAKRFGTTASNISTIKTGRSWSDIAPAI